MPLSLVERLSVLERLSVRSWSRFEYRRVVAVGAQVAGATSHEFTTLLVVVESLIVGKQLLTIVQVVRGHDDPQPGMILTAADDRCDRWRVAGFAFIPVAVANAHRRGLMLTPRRGYPTADLAPETILYLVRKN